MPVPSVSSATSVAPWAIPIRDSQTVWQLASLSTTTGTPSRAAMTSPNATSLSGTLTACTAIPVRESNVQGMPKPIASIGAADRRADLLHRVGDHLHELVLRQTVDKTVGTVDH